MHVMVIADENQQKVLVPGDIPGHAQVKFVTTPGIPDPDLEIHAIIDLCFHPDQERISQLQQFTCGVIIVHSLLATLDDLPAGFVRINGWPGCLEGPLIEAAALNEDEKKKTEKVISIFGKKTEWVPDIPGLLTPRVLSMIINEAYFALEEGVSGK